MTSRISDNAFRDLRAAAEIIAQARPTWWAESGHKALRKAVETLAKAPLSSEEASPTGADLDAVIAAARQVAQRNGLMESLADLAVRSGEALQDIEKILPSPSNPVARWLAQQTVRAPGTMTTAKGLFEAYLSWCGREKIEAVNHRSFGMALSAVGLRRRHSNGSCYLDVALRATGAAG